MIYEWKYAVKIFNANSFATVSINLKRIASNKLGTTRLKFNHLLTKNMKNEGELVNISQELKRMSLLQYDSM